VDGVRNRTEAHTGPVIPARSARAGENPHRFRQSFEGTNLGTPGPPEASLNLLSTLDWVGERADSPCPRCGAPMVANPLPKPGSSRPLLLVVDDEEPVLRIVERLAAKEGFDVATCGSGADALRALLRKPADLALVDLRIPDVNGLDLLRQ